MRPVLRSIAFLALLGLLGGCQRAPTVDILGSFFPIWIFCIAFGIIMAAIARAFFVRIHLDEDLGPGLLIYPCLAALFAFVLWLVFFR